MNNPTESVILIFTLKSFPINIYNFLCLPSGVLWGGDMMNFLESNWIQSGSSLPFFDNVAVTV